MITLAIRSAVSVPIEAETITPHALTGKRVSEIEALPVVQGNATARLGDFFQVSGDADGAVRLTGDCSRVKYIGKGMTDGRIEVDGDAGMHLGAEMRGGEIRVRGSVGDWAGAEMRGGLLRVAGNAGHLLGAAYRGSPKGMRGGTILVEGAAGNEVGCAMRRGLIAVGAAADFAGVMMLAGSIFVLGKLGIRPGAGMKRGTLVTVARDGDAPRLLPTFRFDCEYRPPWLPLYVRRLHELGFSVPPALAATPCRRYSGDFVETGKGEILVWTLA
ncbi:MAG TPA: formylmethanofuran dehydrogenase subunit C [Methylomirabilota bacterium]|nr:formylmethanofuran dehydrogenase subunit C [Methylomirabilota bacterium]